MVLTDVIRSF